MLGWGGCTYKACKVCNTPVVACNKYVKTLLHSMLRLQDFRQKIVCNVLQALLQVCYRLVTYFNRDVTCFTYFLIKEQSIKTIFGD